MPSVADTAGGAVGQKRPRKTRGGEHPHHPSSPPSAVHHHDEAKDSILRLAQPLSSSELSGETRSTKGSQTSLCSIDDYDHHTTRRSSSFCCSCIFENHAAAPSPVGRMLREDGKDQVGSTTTSSSSSCRPSQQRSFCFYKYLRRYGPKLIVVALAVALAFQITEENDDTRHNNSDAGGGGAKNNASFGRGRYLLLVDHTKKNATRNTLWDGLRLTTRPAVAWLVSSNLSSAANTSPSSSSSILQRFLLSIDPSSSYRGSGTTYNNNNNVPSSRNPTLVIAGKMSVLGGPCNIAQYNLKTAEWSEAERIQLSLYNSYSGGEVYSLLANYTASPLATTTSSLSSSSTTISAMPLSSKVGSGELIVVGAFDTTYRNSQVTYCSVGKWNGQELSKVGEGLCNSALSKGMKITTASLAGAENVYVAGSFSTQVWNGDKHEFVQIYNIAHFNAVEEVWSPLGVGQISCSWCTVTVLALAWDQKRRQLHVGGKFNAIDGRNVPAGLAIYNYDTGHLVAHPGGGLTMRNVSQDGVATALQLDQESGVLYVMGSFQRLTQTYELCGGLAAYEIDADRWTCLADEKHSVAPSGGGNMLLTPFGLMVAGKTTATSTWPHRDRPYTIALLEDTLKTRKETKRLESDDDKSDDGIVEERQYHYFNWSWLPGFHGHEEALHALSNGFGDYHKSVFIAGDNLVARWSYQHRTSTAESESAEGSDDDTSRDNAAGGELTDAPTPAPPGYRRLIDTGDHLVPITESLATIDTVRGAIMAISQMEPYSEETEDAFSRANISLQIIVYCVTLGCMIGVIGAIMCNRNITGGPYLSNDKDFRGFSLDTLTNSSMDTSNILAAYNRAMETRHVKHRNLLTIINPQEIFLHRVIGEGQFGRVWSARWGTASVAVKEFVFAQAAVAGRSTMREQIVEEIIGEAVMMAILRHPNVLQLFGCSLTAQAIWIVSELCSLGSLRQMLDDDTQALPIDLRLSLALQVAEGMVYLHNQEPPIIHRDLKSHNILVHETFTENEDASMASSMRADGCEKMDTHSTIVAKIGDWGSARATLSTSRTMTHGVGTACWLAPEVILHARSSKFSDVYSFGIVLWELATREEVYQGLETFAIIAKVANENLRPPVPEDCIWKDLMVRCWAENPLDRLEFPEIVEELEKLKRELSDI